MPSTPFEVVVFDFDGTLVNSAAAKRQAFFDVFPPDCAVAVETVLEQNPDGSRHVVIPRMLDQAIAMGRDTKGLDAALLITAYGKRAGERVAEAAPMPDAEKVLSWWSAVSACYVASMTPHDELNGHIGRLGWHRFLRAAYGYPHSKPKVVAELLTRHAIAPQRLLVVGDGISDRQAAEANGTHFHHITGPESLRLMPGFAEATSA